MTRSFFNKIDTDIKFFLIRRLRDLKWILCIIAGFKGNNIDRYALNCVDSQLFCQGSRGFATTSLVHIHKFSGDVIAAK